MRNSVLNSLEKSLSYASHMDKYRLLVLIDKLKIGEITKQELIHQISLTGVNREELVNFIALVESEDDLIRGTIQ